MASSLPDDSHRSARRPAMERSAPVAVAERKERDDREPQRRVQEAPPPPETILRARGVTKHFGGIHAVDRMDIDVPRGSLTGLIGPNGAGKSTFFHCLSGYLDAEEGTTWFEGRRVDGLPMYRRARLGLVRTFQLTRTLQRMSVLENLMLGPKEQPGERLFGALAFWRASREEEEIRAKAREMLDYFRLSHLADEYAGALSGGQRKLLELARALMLEPSLMLLDEPMAGVNPTLAKELMERIDALRRERGMTFMLVEHDMETVFHYCDPIVVMAEGRPLAVGNAEEIRSNPAVQEAYLGG